MMISDVAWRYRHSRSGKLLIVLIAVVVVVGAGGFFAARHFMGRSEAAAEEQDGEQAQEQANGEKETLGPEETVDLGEFLVNVTDNRQALRYVKAEMSLVVQAIGEQAQEHESGGHGSSSKKKEGAQLPPDAHRLARDVVIRTLSSQRFEDLLHDPGREKLRELLLDELEETLEDYHVNQVLITGFVMQ